MDSLTEDTIYSSDIKIYQNKEGYRFNSDSMILSWFIYQILGTKKNFNSLEIGSGTGIIPIVLNKRGYLSKIECVELQSTLFELLKLNISTNKLEGSLFPHKKDFREFAKSNASKFDLIFTNPPYFKQNEGKISKNNEKAAAKHEISGSLFDFLSVSQNILAYKGHFIFIYPLSKIYYALGAAQQNNFGLKRLFLFREKPDCAPNFFCADLIYKGDVPNSEINMVTIRNNEGNYTKLGLEIMYESPNL